MAHRCAGDAYPEPEVTKGIARTDTETLGGSNQLPVLKGDTVYFFAKAICYRNKDDEVPTAGEIAWSCAALPEGEEYDYRVEQPEWPPVPSWSEEKWTTSKQFNQTGHHVLEVTVERLDVPPDWWEGPSFTTFTFHVYVLEAEVSWVTFGVEEGGIETLWKDGAGTWTDDIMASNGDREVAVPQWTPSLSEPVCYEAGSTPELVLRLGFSPYSGWGGALGFQVQLACTSSDPDEGEADLDLGGQKQVGLTSSKMYEDVTVTTEDELSDYVACHSEPVEDYDWTQDKRRSFPWQIRCVGSTTWHDLEETKTTFFQSWGDPYAPPGGPPTGNMGRVAAKRVFFATRAAEGSQTIQEVADAVWLQLGEPPDPAENDPPEGFREPGEQVPPDGGHKTDNWCGLDTVYNFYYGECDDQARFMRRVLWLLGIPGWRIACENVYGSTADETCLAWENKVPMCPIHNREEWIFIWRGEWHRFEGCCVVVDEGEEEHWYAVWPGLYGVDEWSILRQFAVYQQYSSTVDDDPPWLPEAELDEPCGDPFGPPGP